MEALTVSDLKRLCSERGLTPGKLRKQQIIELLISDGLEELPSSMIVRDTPRKSILTPSRSRRSTIAEAEGGKAETPRSARRKIKMEAAEADKENASNEDAPTPVKRAKRSTRARGQSAVDVNVKEEVSEKSVSDDSQANEEKPKGRNSKGQRRNLSQTMKTSSDEEKPTEVEDTSQGRRRSSRKKSATKRSSTKISEDDVTNEEQGEPTAKKVVQNSDDDASNKALADESKQAATEAEPMESKPGSANSTSSVNGHDSEGSSAAGDDPVQHPQEPSNPNDVSGEKSEINNHSDDNQVTGPLNTSDAATIKNQPSQSDEAELKELTQSPTTPKQSTGGDLTLVEEDNTDDSPPVIRRKTWNLNSSSQLNFARGEDSSPVSSPKGSITPEDAKQSSIAESEKSPPVTIRENTFIVATPSRIKANSKENKESSRTPFKASKTPNFKKIHERDQARMENIADHQIRKRERMRQLLQTTREIRDRGNTSRQDSKTPLKTPLKTPISNIKSSHATPSSSSKKILSAKVRSNRRFELLMKARGINIQVDISDVEELD